MALDFQKVREQVKKLGENAPQRERELQELRERAWAAFNAQAANIDHMRQKVALVVQQHEPNLRCALPVQEPLDFRGALPSAPEKATLIAADGSQIAPDRHAAVDYCLINVGVIQLCLGSTELPVTGVRSQLLYGDDMYTDRGTITIDSLSLQRDLSERQELVDWAYKAEAPVITFTDGPLELWGGQDGSEKADFATSLRAYLDSLSDLHQLRASTAGYVDKPKGNLVLRLLEVLITPEMELPNIRKMHLLRGVSDSELYRYLLKPGERSAVFALQSYSANHYTGPLALHFFYLNVGRPEHPWLARVEIPRWVAEDPTLLDQVHAALIAQCRIMGARPYPYLLHRAHEAALVSYAEKEQVTQMILMELRRRGVPVGEESYKQAAKNLAGRTTYKP